MRCKRQIGSGASYDLSWKDPAGYRAYRAPRQAGLAAALAILFAILLFFEPLRQAALVLVGSALGWGAWSLSATDVRELPPPPLQLLSVSGIAFLSAGAVVALLSLKPIRMKVRWASYLFAPIGAGALALLIGGWSRSARIFPIGSEGWELLFDPLSCLILGGGGAFVLQLVGSFVARIGKRNIALPSA